MGLFLGFSFISAFEVVYFISMRWMTDLWRRNQGIKKSKRIHSKKQDDFRRIIQKKILSNEKTTENRRITISHWHRPFIHKNNKNLNNFVFVK